MTKNVINPPSHFFKHPLSKIIVLGTFFLILSLGSSCSKKMAADKMPANRIEFGHGGGFTGAVTTYVLLNNGRMYQELMERNEYNKLRRISKDEATTLFEECEKLRTLKTDSPGNMYYFVTIKDSVQIPRRWIFGDPSVAPPAELEALYKRLVGLVPKKD
jgi:hypothetical protein